MKENALKGLWNGGNVPFGYVINNERKLDIDPQAAPVIQEIFKLCNDGKTVKEIYRIMNERKVTRSNGKALRYNAIRYMLSNRVYNFLLTQRFHSDANSVIFPAIISVFGYAAGSPSGDRLRSARSDKRKFYLENLTALLPRRELSIWFI